MNTDYDIAIVGAGIHGAGIAQAAAACGYRTLVLEQQSIAAGTSSHSSKLIHGGLRYLEQFDLRLVRECLRERELLLRLAPKLVKLTPFFIPVYRHTRRRSWEVCIGLSLYAVLGGLHAHARFHRMPRADWNDLTGLSQDGLQAVYRYWDAQTDDSALTRAVMLSAENLGAELLMPAVFERAQLGEHGCEIVFRHNGVSNSVQTSVLVNAAGPWVDQVAARISPGIPRPDIALIQGSHIILDSAIVDSIYYVEAPQDGRAVFIMPWHDETTLVGTTETPFTGMDPGQARPLPEEKNYLLEVVRRYFPKARLNIRSSFAGIRVLPAGQSRIFRRSREILYVIDRKTAPRVLGVYGGKLTSYRADAQRALKMLRHVLPPCRPVADTCRLALDPQS